MKQKQRAAELTSVGDFMLAAEAETASVHLVTGFGYGGMEIINQPGCHMTVPKWVPEIEKIPVVEVPERINSLLEGYGRLANSRFGSGVSLDTTSRAISSVEKLQIAQQELQGLKLAP